MHYLLSLALLMCASAHAELSHVVLATVQSDIYPGEVYTIGADLDETGKQVGLYYIDPNQGNPANRERHFTLASLSSPQVLVRVKDKYNMIKISYVDSIFTIDYRRDAMRDEFNPKYWHSKDLKIVGDQASKVYSLVDADTGESVKRIYIHKHVNPLLRITVGIEDIDTEN